MHAITCASSPAPPRSTLKHGSMGSVHVWEGSAARAARSERGRGLPNREGATSGGNTCSLGRLAVALDSKANAGYTTIAVSGPPENGKVRHWVEAPLQEQVGRGEHRCKVQLRSHQHTCELILAHATSAVTVLGGMSPAGAAG